MNRAADDIRARLGLRPIINVSGTMTALGASIMVPEAVAAMAAIGPEFVEMEALFRLIGDESMPVLLRTALAHAESRGFKEIARLLRDAGAH